MVSEHFTLDDIHFSTNLALLPDISATGLDYYTLIIYQINILAQIVTAMSMEEI